MTIQFYSHRDRPEFSSRLDELEGESFPPFLLHDGFDECRPHLLNEFAEYQLYFCDEDNGKLLGAGNAVPYFQSPGELLPKFQQLLTAAPEQHAQHVLPNVLCPIQAMVVNDARGSGISKQIILAYKDLAQSKGFNAVNVPVRPTLKSQYPLASIERYIHWLRDDGSSFDPWIRMQERTGANFVEITLDSTVITGSVADWEVWTDMRFPESGEFIISGGHAPLVINCENNSGRYAEPHVWYSYDMT